MSLNHHVVGRSHLSVLILVKPQHRVVTSLDHHLLPSNQAVHAETPLVELRGCRRDARRISIEKSTPTIRRCWTQLRIRAKLQPNSLRALRVYLDE